MKQMVKDYEDKEDLVKRSVEEMEHELTEIRKVYELSHTKNIVLEKELQ
jgi:phage shock protein A